MYTAEDVTIILPSYNTPDHLENAYKSVRKYYPTVPISLVNDGGDPETFRKMMHWKSEDKHLHTANSTERKGHTYWYDSEIRSSEIHPDTKTRPVISILHSDMVVGPNYLENMLKHLGKNRVVCATRVEPPIHPDGKEKIIRNFGMEANEFDFEAFEKFCVEEQEVSRDETTKGIFAPWTMLREDFLAIGGHDQRFAPYGYEDSDIFNRWILNGYQMVQSRDSLCYHMTCRGHRWNKGVGIENSDYKDTMTKNAREFIRKWGDWIMNNSYQYPIIHPKYDRGILLYNATEELLYTLEPWADAIYVDIPIDSYIEEEQLKTVVSLKKKVKGLDDQKNHDIFIQIDGRFFDEKDFQVIQHISAIAKQPGRFQVGNLKIEIEKLEDHNLKLIQNEKSI